MRGIQKEKIQGTSNGVPIIDHICTWRRGQAPILAAHYISLRHITIALSVPRATSAVHVDNVGLAHRRRRFHRGPEVASVVLHTGGVCVCVCVCVCALVGGLDGCTSERKTIESCAIVCLSVWLTDAWVGRLAGWSVGRSVHWLVGRSVAHRRSKPVRSSLLCCKRSTRRAARTWVERCVCVCVSVCVCVCVCVRVCFASACVCVYVRASVCVCVPRAELPVAGLRCVRV